MYKHFGYFGKYLKVNIFLFPDFAKCRPYVIHIRINGSLSDSIRTSLRTKFIRILIQTTRIAPTLFNLFHFLSAYAMRILILIRRRGIGPVDHDILLKKMKMYNVRF